MALRADGCTRYDLEGGESSVFDRELKGSKSESYKNPKRKLVIAGRDYEHEDFCLACFDGGKIVSRLLGSPWRSCQGCQ